MRETQFLFVCKNPRKREKSLECFEVQIRLNEAHLSQSCIQISQLGYTI